MCYHVYHQFFPSGTCFAGGWGPGIFQNDICNICLENGERNPFFNSTKPQTLGRSAEAEKNLNHLNFLLRNSDIFSSFFLLYFISIFSLSGSQVNSFTWKTYQKEWKLLDHASMSVWMIAWMYTIVFSCLVLVEQGLLEYILIWLQCRHLLLPIKWLIKG